MQKKTLDTDLRVGKLVQNEVSSVFSRKKKKKYAALPPAEREAFIYKEQR